MGYKGVNMSENDNEKTKQRKLTKKEELFILAYTGEAKFNATKAAKIAGYGGTKDSLRVIGHENLTKLNISEKIKKLTEQRLKDAGYQVGRVTKEIIDNAFADITDFMDKKGKIVIKKGEQPTGAIKKLKYKDGEIVEIDLQPKCNFIEMLSKLLQMAAGINKVSLVDEKGKGIPITEITVVREAETDRNNT